MNGGTRLEPDTGERLPAYADRAVFYDRDTAAFQGFRRAVVDALPVRPGEAVLDVGCGTAARAPAPPPEPRPLPPTEPGPEPEPMPHPRAAPGAAPEGCHRGYGTRMPGPPAEAAPVARADRAIRP